MTRDTRVTVTAVLNAHSYLEREDIDAVEYATVLTQERQVPLARPA